MVGRVVPVRGGLGGKGRWLSTLGFSIPVSRTRDLGKVHAVSSPLRAAVRRKPGGESASHVVMIGYGGRPQEEIGSVVAKELKCFELAGGTFTVAGWPTGNTGRMSLDRHVETRLRTAADHPSPSRGELATHRVLRRRGARLPGHSRQRPKE